MSWVRTTSSSFFQRSTFFTGSFAARGERLPPARLLFLPRGLEKRHAVHALDRLQQVPRTPDRPPAVARRLHEAEAPAQLRVLEGRRVADEASGGNVEAEKREPV